MPMVFPTSPAVGQVFSSGGRSWVWTGSTWDSPSSATAALSGLSQIVPTSVVKGASGTASVSAGGLVTISGTESISLNGIFTPVYDAYKVLIYLKSSSGSNRLQLRTRVGGADLTTATYRHVSFYTNSAVNSFSGLSQNSADSVGILSYTGVQGNAIEFDIFNPNITDYTHVRSTSSFSDSTNMFVINSAIVVNNTTSYDGFTLFPTAANITGTIRVYGYKKD